MALDEDLVCAQCGYNLRGLGEEGRCPECAESIASSRAAAERYDLARADRRWVRLMAMAPMLMLLGQLAWQVGWLVRIGALPRPARLSIYAYIVLPGIILSAAVWCALAAWRLGMKEPHGSPNADCKRLRIWLRVLAIGTLMSLPMWWMRFRVLSVAYFLSFFYLSFSLAGTVLIHVRLGKLARRGGYGLLARLHVWAALLVPVLSVLIVLIHFWNDLEDVISVPALMGWGMVSWLPWHIARGLPGNLSYPLAWLTLFQMALMIGVAVLLIGSAVAMLRVSWRRVS